MFYILVILNKLWLCWCPIKWIHNIPAFLKPLLTKLSVNLLIPVISTLHVFFFLLEQSYISISSSTLKGF